MERQWVLTDHLCRRCGGRVLRCIKGNGMSLGGNAVHKCADCGIERAHPMGPESICWCGFNHKHNHHLNAYRCLPFKLIKEYPKLKEAFLACGCDPRRGEVGIVLEGDIRDYLY